tara:strand:+ start:2574 stop:3629 length:1056 start_codon:yes stop_codon:yes gene_type:complete
MNKILITGGAGFIGSHTCLILLNKGYEIFVIDSNINSSPKSLDVVKQLSQQNKNQTPNLHFFKGDIRNKDKLNEIFSLAQKNGEGIKSVIHFAGKKAVNESILKPLDYWDANVNGTLNLLKVMEENHCKSIVFSSSATIYGLSHQKPIKENEFINPINPYGNTKAAIEKILNDLSKKINSDWKVAILRYFNPIGAHESGLLGENPKDIPNNILPLLIKAAGGLMKEFKVFGNDWQTYDGTGVRDYIHVMDLAEAHLRALEYISIKKINNLKLNIGTGKGTSVIELINTFQKVNKVKIPYKFVSRREGDIPYSVADNSLAKSTLGWLPKRDIENMCRDSWNWYLKNPNGYKI